MKLMTNVNDMLDKVYVTLTLLGDSDVEQRKFNATMCLTLWICLFLGFTYIFIDQWIYPVHEIYATIWPYHSLNARSFKSNAFPLATASWLVGYLIARNSKKRCANKIAFRSVTYADWFRRGGILFAAIMVSGFFASMKYGVPFVIIGSILLFFQLARVGQKMLAEDMAQGREK